MRKIVFSFLISLASLAGSAQTSTRILRAGPLIPKTTTINHKLGSDYIQIKVYKYGTNKDLFFINLHDDEITAVSGAKRILEIHGGTLVKIENNHKRNIRFRMDGKLFAFDPNRIFSRVGIIQTLTAFSSLNNKSLREIEKFANRILELLPPPPTFVIALHNNSNGKFSVTAYMHGKEREQDAKAIHHIPAQDPDDLFLTTDSLLFQRLTREKYNAILQDNVNAHKDGSLSVYCGEKNINYLNCETQHGKLRQYSDMIIAATRYIRKQVPDALVYNYHISSKPDSIPLPEACDIFFGEKKVGSIKKKASADPNGSFAGQMEIMRSFPLFDNMDFYYMASSNDSKIELRIDPTRDRKKIDALTTSIPVKVR